MLALSSCQDQYDVVVYGGSSAGISAAISASRNGKTVIILEPSDRIGGLSTGGLGQTDAGKSESIKGISKEFYKNVYHYYDIQSNWKWQESQDYKPAGSNMETDSVNKTMWTFEPSAALKIFKDMIKQEKVAIKYGEKLNRKDGVLMSDNRIISITTLNGKTYNGSVFIDATYEGDLMAAAGVSYTVGREANDLYDETLNGIQKSDYAYSLRGVECLNAANHNFMSKVDPYVEKGDSTSGLLPYINAEYPEEDGKGDNKVQAYCFRLCITDHPENKIDFLKPEGYKEQNYELLFRNFEAGLDIIPWLKRPMPNRKTDVNNETGFSMNFIGQNYDYPEADYEKREEIVLNHRLYQQGLMWTLANHPRVPEKIRKEVSRWGMCKDEFIEGDGWQNQLYIREARRMLGEYVVTQHDCEGLRKPDDIICYGSYGMDSHHTQRYVDTNGFVRNEGNVQSRKKILYPISYGAITPKEEECNNLLVPVCVSASHIAFGSIRMEPVFMMLGECAAIAACEAIDNKLNVQSLEYKTLKDKLIENRLLAE